MSNLINNIGGLVSKLFMTCESHGAEKIYLVVCQFHDLRLAQQLYSLLLDCCKERPPEPTEQQINSACLSYDHSFGLMATATQEELRQQAKEWLQAWQKEGL